MQIASHTILTSSRAEWAEGVSSTILVRRIAACMICAGIVHNSAQTVHNYAQTVHNYAQTVHNYAL
jgi:hypothetical protein